jgi:hypothetical protein
MRRRPIRPGDDGGSAVVDFTLVGILLTFLFLALLQLGLALHVRNGDDQEREQGERFGQVPGTPPRNARTPFDGRLLIVRRH